MRTHLLQKKILDTAELAKEAEEYASIIPNYWKTHKPPVSGNPNSNLNFRRGNQNFQNGNQPKPQNGNQRFQTNQTKPQNGNQKFPNVQSRPQGGNRQNSRPHPYSRDQRTQWRNDPNSQNSLNRPPFQNQPSRFPQNRNPNQGKPQAPQARAHKAVRVLGPDRPILGTGNGQYSQKQVNEDNSYFINTCVEGKPLRMWRDTACTDTLINKTHVPNSCLTGDYMTIQGIGPSLISIPTAEVDIQGDDILTQGKIIVGVVEDLPYDGLLGNDIGPRVHWVKPKSVLVVTRAQKRQEVIEEIQAQDTMRIYLQSQSQASDEQSQATQTSANNMADTLQPTVVSPEVKSLLQGNVQDLIDFQGTDETF